MTAEKERPDEPSRVHAEMARLQDRLLALVGGQPSERGATATGMVRRDATEATSYWLQLVVAAGIATLGLVTGSSAVIIGAMLVAPLMGPILGLAMGLSTGSPLLVLRATLRVGASVAFVIGAAAGTTRLLPFRELNGEILARTSPTALDLVTAAFCALAGLYATLRTSSDTATTAAGTSIGISLVPPLCVCGYGLGTAATHIARGAALLFLTNMVAIVFVGTLGFLATGFNRVDARAMDVEEIERDGGHGLTSAAARRLEPLFAARSGPWLRVLMPVLLLGAVWVPLLRALDEVTWRVRVQAAIRSALAGETGQIVDTRSRLGRQQVEIVVVLVGSSQDALAARERIAAQVEAVAEMRPRVEVLAVADAAAFAGLESRLAVRPAPEPPPPPPPPPTAEEQLANVQLRLRFAVDGLWPAESAGEPLSVSFSADEGDTSILRVVHLGPPLGPDAREALRKGVEAAIGRALVLVDVALPPGPFTRSSGDAAFADRVGAAARGASAVADLRVCVWRPAAANGQRPKTNDKALEAALLAVGAETGNVTMQAHRGDWEARVVAGACPAGDTSVH